MIDISKISSLYDIRRMDDSDVDSILNFCRKNTQFYEYCEAEPTREQVLGDLHITPPGIGLPTNLENFLRSFAGQAELTHLSVLVPLLLSAITAAEPQTGHLSGTVKVPSLLITDTHLGIILFAFIICSIVFPFSPMPSLSISLILQSDALETVVPSS